MTTFDFKIEPKNIFSPRRGYTTCQLSRGIGGGRNRFINIQKQNQCDVFCIKYSQSLTFRSEVFLFISDISLQ